MVYESESHSVVSDSLRPRGLYSPWNSAGQNTGVGSPSLLQRLFQTQGLNWGLLHCKWILYPLSYQGSPDCVWHDVNIDIRPSLVAQMVKNLPAIQETQV